MIRATLKAGLRVVRSGWRTALWKRKGYKLHGYPDRWAEWQREVASRLQTLAINLPNAMSQPPRLYLPNDQDLLPVRDAIAHILSIPFTESAARGQEDGFTERIGDDVITAIRESTWQGFVNVRMNETASVVHELGHVEEQRRFGPFPKDNRLRNCRLIWAEFFAEQTAARFYDHGRGRRLASGLGNAMAGDEIERVTSDIGRILGFCHGFNQRLQDYWGLHAGIKPECQRTGDQLLPILRDALHANQLPDLEQIYKALDPLLS